MNKRKVTIDIDQILKGKFSRLYQTLEEEGKLRQSNVRQSELSAIHALMKKHLLATAIVLFLGFSHGDFYPLGTIVDALEVEQSEVEKVLKKLKKRGLVYTEQIGLPIDFYALDKDLLFSSIKNIKKERLQQAGADIEIDPYTLYREIRLHPRIKAVTQSLFTDGHYAQAIFEAFKCVEVMVREKSGSSGSGQTMMASVFNENSPLLRLNSLSTRSDRDEQIGFKLIFMGCMTGIRNPKAHDIVQQKDPIRTIEYLALASLLARRVGESLTR